jgi:hypothetical protein
MGVGACRSQRGQPTYSAICAPVVPIEASAQPAAPLITGPASTASDPLLGAIRSPPVHRRTGGGKPAAQKGPEMTSRLRLLWLALGAATATAAVFTTPAILAGLTFNALD